MCATGEPREEGSPPVKQKTLEDGDNKTPTSGAKVKSSTRRRPRKDRRSTGLPFEVSWFTYMYIYIYI